MASNELWGWVKALALAVVLALVIRGYILAFYLVDGNSMEPSLHNGQLVAVNKLVYRFNEPSHGDVIVFIKEAQDSNSREDRIFIKRIIALPGDTVAIRDGAVILNGNALDEDYIDAAVEDSLEPLCIDEGMVFVMGDNRTRYGSWDSRDFGPISLDTVLGRADAVIFPVPGRID